MHTRARIYKRICELIFPCRQRIPSKNVFYYRSPEHNKNYVLTIAFAFDKEKDVYHFAYSYPYSYSRLQAYLSKLDQMNADCCRKELLAFSVVRMYLCSTLAVRPNILYLCIISVTPELRVIHEANVTSCDVVEAHATALNWKGALMSHHVARG